MNVNNLTYAIDYVVIGFNINMRKSDFCVSYFMRYFCFLVSVIAFLLYVTFCFYVSGVDLS